MIRVISEVIEVTLDDQGKLGIQKINQSIKLYEVKSIKV